MTKIDKPTITAIADFAKNKIKLENYQLDSEYFYQSLPLCVIDSVYSIAVRYEAVKNVVNNFCDYNKLTVFREDKNSHPKTDMQFSVNDFINLYGNTDPEELANNIFKNRQRTSPKNGILKAEAVVLFLKELSNEGINYFQDLENLSDNFEQRVKLIKGQKSGLSLDYFYMLAGNDNLIKPDRMVIRFIVNIIGKPISQNDCQAILTKVCIELGDREIKISPRELDNAIWNYQRNIN